VSTALGVLGVVGLATSNAAPAALLLHLLFTGAALIAAVGATRRWRVAQVGGVIAGALMFLDGLFIVGTASGITIAFRGAAATVGLVVLAAGAALAGLLLIPRSSRAWFAR
jgi:hypothetical protein